MRLRSSWMACFSAARASDIFCHSFALSCCAQAQIDRHHLEFATRYAKVVRTSGLVRDFSDFMREMRSGTHKKERGQKGDRRGQTIAAKSLASACFACLSSSRSLRSAALCCTENERHKRTRARKRSEDSKQPTQHHHSLTSSISSTALSWLTPDFCQHRSVCHSKVVPDRLPAQLLSMHPAFVSSSLS
jgi:hypothetical protein